LWAWLVGLVGYALHTKINKFQKTFSYMNKMDGKTPFNNHKKEIEIDINIKININKNDIYTAEMIEN
jgi:hypothetical protein